MPNSFIATNQEQLDNFCASASVADFIALDTEFLREKTYWPKLCLVQMALPDHVILLDPFIQGIDWTPFYALLQNPSVTKVLHSARQDLEIFWKMTGALPQNIYDTQIAAQVCGYGESISYDRLVQSVLRISIDKNSQYTDWSRRPLSDKQLKYAAGDVIHLAALYPLLQDKVVKAGRSEWIESDMKALLNVELYQPDPEKSWQRLRFKSNNRRALAALKKLAAWREVTAQARNLPRGFILKDETLVEVASHLPHSAHEMESIRGLPNNFTNGDWGQQALAIIAEVEQIPQHDLPHVTKQVQRPDYGDAMDLLRVLLRHVAEKEDVAAKLIVTGDELEELASGEYKMLDDAPAYMQGWRLELFGRKALALLHGEIGLRLRDGAIAFE